VFCRNVLIYFDQPTKSAVLDRLANVTEREGYLVLGGAETVVGLTSRFKLIADKRGLYAQSNASAAPSNVVSFSAPEPALAGSRG
jgi:chemotaxis protein methyltransferase CheR